MGLFSIFLLDGHPPPSLRHVDFLNARRRACDEPRISLGIHCRKAACFSMRAGALRWVDILPALIALMDCENVDAESHQMVAVVLQPLLELPVVRLDLFDQQDRAIPLDGLPSSL